MELGSRKKLSPDQDAVGVELRMIEHYGYSTVKWRTLPTRRVSRTALQPTKNPKPNVWFRERKDRGISKPTKRPSENDRGNCNRVSTR